MEQLGLIRDSLLNMDHNILCLIGFALFFGTIGGRLFQKLRIPQVVGYIIIGIIIGESGLKFISQETVSNMDPFNFFALGLIGFSIGGELKASILKKYGKQFTWILFLEALIAFFVVGVIMFCTVFLLTKNTFYATALALLFGSISSATAAAGTTDVLWEYKAKGPMTSILLGIVALDDVVALFLFAISASIISSIQGGGDGNATSLLMNIVTPIIEIGGAVVIGVIAGYILSYLVRHYQDAERVLSFSIGAILAALGISGILKFDTIMTCMVMGFVLTNTAGKAADAMFSLINKFTPPIYVVFFVFVGAKLNISQFGKEPVILLLLFLYLGGRTLGKMIGATLGAIFGKASAKIRRYLPFGLFSQSGVAIGLSILAMQRFPGEIGNNILIVVTASTFIVQIVGPFFLKYAIENAGEAGLNITEDDIIEKSCAADFIRSKESRLQCEDNLKTILKVFSENDDLYYPVVTQNDKLAGVISVNEIKDTLMYSEISDLLAAIDLMSSFDSPVLPGTPMKEVIDILHRTQSDFVAVIDQDGKFCGLIEQYSIQRQLSTKLLEVCN
ncbi:MAG: cation:proton antiporter, partial [Spirochaetales bacterium]|nr:cation:proton antiporter [Spirochaetales bacterium]